MPVSELLIYASRHCMGWQDVQNLVEKLESDPEFHATVVIRDPQTHQREFREKGLVICPSFLYRDELIAVGVPTADQLKKEIQQHRYAG